MINLYVFPPSPRAFKVLAAATHLGLEYNLRFVDLPKGEHKTPEFAALNPNRRMPVLEEDGFVLWESNAILQYLAAKKPESGMLPTDARGRADVARWLCWDLAHWDPACALPIFENLVKKLLNLGDPDPKEIARGHERFHAVAQVLDGQLKDRQYITGDKPTVADFSIGAPLNLARPAAIPLDPYAHIKRWHATLSELPAWRKVLETSLPPRPN
ncbi:MAG TPA: glutathione S-transferase family protein [Steroidobacteraceae bacterium]|nr:glutathione S-transferase family protein [Steroidobacteraceae bacterium]